jgi:SOUL heme-binding protein
MLNAVTAAGRQLAEGVLGIVAEIAERTDKLLNTLRANGVEVIGAPVAWFFDPPWTLPFRRRNEVAVPVA